jgi:uncharacterized YigZ family protein
MNIKSYLTIQQAASYEINVERSRFIGHCQEVATAATAREFVAAIRARHAQATHNCYAYRVGAGPRPSEYYQDHGEPSGTAGKPILGGIQRLQLTNVVVVVTRYFGGKKLGIRGLIAAYGKATTLVLETAGTVRRIPRFTVRLTYRYADHSLILHRLAQIEALIIATQYTENITTTFAIPETNRIACHTLLAELPVTILS